MLTRNTSGTSPAQGGRLAEGVEARDADNARVRRALLRWFRRNARKLPWREDAQNTQDPQQGAYRVWLSEIMLQQTQVTTVIPYYARFVARFPTLQSLAAAELQEVLKLWSGLGYYRRAHNLHATARLLAERQQHTLPSDNEALRALPGIGRYTAGAILSIAFNQPAPLLDGNVMRVLTRLDGLGGDPKNPALNATLWARAEALVRRSRKPGAVNESLMELGALVCSPRAPSCAVCPLRSRCVAFQEGRPERYPQPPPRPKRPLILAACVLLRDRRGALLLGRRRPGLLGGLWEPIQLPAASAHRFAPRGQLRHIFTHRELLLEVYEGRLRARGSAPGPTPDLYEQLAWEHDPESRPLSSLARKALALGCS